MLDNDAFRRRMYKRYASTHTMQGRTLEVKDASTRPARDRLIRRWVPADRATRILDIGCGDGALMRRLQAHGYQRVYGIDTSPEQVELAGVNAICGDLLEVLCKMVSESEDVVVAFDVLEHFGKGELILLGDEIHRVLRPGGRFIVHVPNGAAVYDDFTHETGFTPSSMRQYLQTIGFADIRIEGDSPTVHGLRSAVRALLWQAVALGARVARVAETGAWSGGVFSRNLLAVADKAPCISGTSLGTSARTIAASRSRRVVGRVCGRS